MREDLKFKQTLVNLNIFYTECKNYLTMPDFMEDITPESRAKDKEKIKKFHIGLENFKTKKESESNFIIQEPI
jgi:hypothetical protein